MTLKAAQIDYPCEWTFRLIGTLAETLAQAVAQCLGDKAHALTPANASATGKYVSLNLVCQVGSEDERNTLFMRLKDHPHVLMVL